MKISNRTISFLAKTISGDNKVSFYRSGPELVEFFNEIGFNDKYGPGFPTRSYYAEGKIRKLNDSEKLSNVFEELLDPRYYINNPGMREDIASKLNKYLEYEKYRLVKINDFYKVKDLESGTVETSRIIRKLSHEFIEEQINKCEQKLIDGDYDGAITNSRSLVEAVFIEIEKKMNKNPPNYDGDLTNLYKRIKKLLNLEPNRKDIDNCLKQVFGGLNSVVVGITGLRNKMSDSHARTYKPEKHHAKLVMNSSKTLVNFILDTYEYQSHENVK